LAAAEELAGLVAAAWEAVVGDSAVLAEAALAAVRPVEVGNPDQSL